MLFPENLVVFNVSYVNLYGGISQDCGNLHNTLANYSGAVRLTFTGFLTLAASEKRSFLGLSTEKTYFCTKIKEYYNKRWNELLITTSFKFH